jgi:hypothetical protein
MQAGWHNRAMRITSPTRTVLPRLGALAFGAWLALAPGLSQAQSGGKQSNALRFLAVGGSLSSLAWAAWSGAPLMDCKQAHWQARSQLARDAELDLVSVGAAFGECQMLTAGSWSLSHQTSAMVGRWSTRGTVPGAESAWDVAVVPLLHWQHAAFDSHRVEFEVGVGPAFLSEPDIGKRQKSTQFQFSDHLGLNLVSGDGRWRVGLAWRHISNLDIQTPNNGVDFKGVTLAFSL